MVIEAPANSDTNIYLNKLQINGQESTKNYIDFETLRNGGRMECEMTDRPNKQRGVNDADFPYSFTNELKKK